MTMYSGEARALVDYLHNAGADVTDVMRRAGIGSPDRMIRNGALPRQSLDSLWMAAADTLRRPALGLHVAREWISPTAPTGRRSLLSAKAEYARAALRLGICFDEIADVQARWNRHYGTLVVVISDPALSPDAARFRSEYALAVVALAARRLLAHLTLKAVDFEHHNRASEDEYSTILGIVPRFNQHEGLIALQCRFAAASASARDCERMLLESRTGASTADSDRTPLELKRLLLASGDARKVSLAQAARRLGVGPRTLQRRLRSEGLTYRHVVGQALEASAKSLLNARGAEMRTVASELGFSDVGTFRRAFRRWTGTNPERLAALSDE